MKVKLIGFLILSAIGLISIYKLPQTELNTTVYIHRSPSSLLTYATSEHLKSRIIQSTKTIVVVNFWASWCTPCVDELPGIASLMVDNELRNIEFLYMSLDSKKDLEAAEKLIQKVEITSMVKHPKDNKFMSTIFPAWSGVIPITMIFSNNGEALEVINGAIESVDLKRKLLQVLKEFE